MEYFIGRRNIGKETFERGYMSNKVLYIETNDFMHVDRYFTITIAFQEAEYALKDPDGWKRFTSILKKVMENELTKEGDKK